MPEILLATKNAGKLRELRELTAGWPVTCRSLADLDVPDSPEDGATFAANARQKALYYAERTGLLTLADDSGLEVDALDGAPGVHSARYAGSPKSDAANNRKLLSELSSVPASKRQARFRCAMAFARRGEILCESDGTVEGLIIDTPRGDNGFGYDPLFFIPALGRTTAELTSDEKHASSHRGQAFRNMLPQMEAVLRSAGQWRA